MRFLHLIVVAALVAAAIDVYKIKAESIAQAERAAKLGVEIRREREAIAALRAEWAQLDNPARIQALTQRHLGLKPMDAFQVDSLDHLPERQVAPPAAAPEDAMGYLIESLEEEPVPPPGPIEVSPVGTIPPELRATGSVPASAAGPDPAQPDQR